MTMKQTIFTIYTIAILALISNVLNAQIQVFESERSDSTKYLESSYQDSIFIVYKGGNNRSTITLFANYMGIDSLNYEWSKFNNEIKSFVFLEKTDTVKSDTLIFDNPDFKMDTVAGGYRVRIFNEDKNIDTVFTAWVWYQSFNVNRIEIIKSTCEQLSLEAVNDFDAEYTYFDLSTNSTEELTLTNGVTFNWTVDPSETDEKAAGEKPRFVAPVEATSYNVVATDEYNYVREKAKNIDESEVDKNGWPIIIATKAGFSGIHGLSDEIEPSPHDTAITVEAPSGVWFTNDSKNGVDFEWVFYNHTDWETSIYDTLLPIDNYEIIKSSFEPGDSIYYKRPKRKKDSPNGYEVKLTSWGPEYSDFGDRCFDTVRTEFVIVDTTQFPTKFEQLPNVFTPDDDGEGLNNYFYFVQKEGSEPDVQSIKYFSIKIYNRWGNKVYEYEDKDGSWHEDGKANPGWDGTTRVGTKAKPGVYYYAILAEGWDGRNFKVGGYVHIF